MMIKYTPPILLLIALCLCIGLVCADESNVTIIEENQTTAIPDTSNLPVERIAQGQCVEIGRYYDISGVIGWSTQFSYYGKYDTDLSPENGTYRMEKIIDHPMTMAGLSKYYIDPEIFGNSEGYWYQVSTLSVNSNHEWAGNLRAFKVQSYCQEQNPIAENITQSNKIENISSSLPLPEEHVTDILVVRGDGVSYNNPKISEGSRTWAFGTTDGLYDQPTINETLVFNSDQTQSLPEGRYHVIVDSPGKNGLVESKYNENDVVSSPLKATPDLSFRGLSSQVAYGNYVDWMWKYSDDELTLVDMQVQDPYIDIYSIETTDVVNHTGITIKGYTNLRSGSVVYGVINEDDYGALATKSYGAVIGDSVGDMRQFIIQSKVDINDLVVGKELFVTVHGEHNAKTTVPFYVYPSPADHYVDKQYNKYIAGNLYVPTPPPEIITLPSPTPEVIVQTVTITVPVTPTDEQVRKAQGDVILGGAVYAIVGILLVAIGIYIASLYVRGEK